MPKYTAAADRAAAAAPRVGRAVRTALWVSLGATPLLFIHAQPGLPAFFSDTTKRSKLDFVNQSSPTSRKYLIESMTGGVAVFDYDGDGLLDIFLVNGAALTDPMPAGGQPDKSSPRFWNRLYRNNGDGTFTDVTEKAGVRGAGFGMGVAAADYDNDGWVDLYV